MFDINSIACNLLSGGWTSEDKEELIVQYGLSDEEAEIIISEMKRIEN